MDLDGIVIMTADSGLPLFSRLNFDDTLFSGLLTAIRSFSKELQLGGISSFSTENDKSVYLISRSRILIAVITSNESDFHEVYSLGYNIGESFESQFDLEKTSVVNSSVFDSFSETFDEIVKDDSIPYIIKVAEFAHKEFGGDLSIQPVLINRDQEDVKIDLVLDRGHKKRTKLMGKLAAKMMKAFSKDVTFVKVIEGTAGRGEVMDFFDSLKTFGSFHTKKSKVYPYFPARAVVIAEDFSPTVFEELQGFKKHKDKVCIPGTHVAPDAGMPGAPAAAKCFIELWKWHDEKYPERIFN